MSVISCNFDFMYLYFFNLVLNKFRRLILKFSFLYVLQKSSKNLDLEYNLSKL